MASVLDHYEMHLAPRYTWMAGGAAPARERFAALLRTLALAPTHPDATALDLGAGSGFQTLPLAAAGYHVTALDFSPTLLAELSRDAAAENLSALITPVCADLRDLSRHVPSPAPELIVCLGDTLPHLASLDDVARVLAASAAALAPGGHLVLSFRDYTTARTGADRFIPVRSDADRLFTCFLDYSTDRVAVHDILQTRADAAAPWHTSISVYEKLRLSPVWVRAQLAATGLTLVHDTATAGLITLAARRPA